MCTPAFTHTYMCMYHTYTHTLKSRRQHSSIPVCEFLSKVHFFFFFFTLGTVICPNFQSLEPGLSFALDGYISVSVWKRTEGSSVFGDVVVIGRNLLCFFVSSCPQSWPSPSIFTAGKVALLCPSIAPNRCRARVPK